MCLLSFVWRLGIGHWQPIGGKREKGKEKRRSKKKDQKARKGLRLLQSPFFFCVLLPHFTISRAPFSFLFSIKENKSERVHRKTARARTHTHSHAHAHAPHALSQKPPFHFLWKSSSHPSVRLNANEIFLSVFVLFFCVCVCGASSTFSSFVTREREERWIERSADIRRLLLFLLYVGLFVY